MTNANDQWYHEHERRGVSSEERVWSMLAHLSAIIAMVVSAGWLSFVGPFVVWVLQKDKSTYVRSAAAQSFNFNLGMALMAILGWVAFFTIIGIPVAIILWVLAFILTVWHHLKATLAASRNETYRYPFQIKILD